MPKDPRNLFQEGTEKRDLEDKKMVEALRKKLTEKLSKDLQAQKKAAAVLSEWINQKKKGR